MQENSWQEQMRRAFKSSDELAKFLEIDLDTQPFNIFIPPNFADKIKQAGRDSVLWKQFVPDQKENQIQGFFDPIGDEIHSQDNGIIHRYKNRILFSPTTICPINCRYCFRKNELNEQSEFLKSNTDKLIEYLSAHPEVEEVILTGGDPLILNNKKLDLLLTKISQVKTVHYLRFHTRTPIILPERIDDGFIELLYKFKQKFTTLSMAIHTNHKDEIDDSCALALRKLQQTHIQLLSQSVLLKAINDSSEDLIALYKCLNEFSIRPYYLHHPDQVMGAMHFYLSLPEGRKIYAQLRHRLPGWLLPHYIVDSPMGHGKSLAFNPEGFKFSGHLIDRHGQLQVHQEPV